MRTVQQLIAVHFNIAPGAVDNDLKLNNLRPDDLDIAEVIMEIEDEFGIDIIGDRVADIWKDGTVSDLVRLVHERRTFLTGARADA